MDVTVGIANYNRAEFLARAIESAKGASEIIVVDDCSTDKSLQVLQEYDVRLVVHKENSGSLIQGWNDIIERATGDWLFLLSADDEMTPRTIPLIQEYQENADWIWGKLELINKDSNPDGMIHMDMLGYDVTVPACQEYMRNSLSLFPTMIAAFRMEWIRKHNLRAVGFETTKQFGDTLTGWNWLKTNPRLKYIPEIFARYRKWSGAESNWANPAFYQKEFMGILRAEAEAGDPSVLTQWP